MSKKALTISLLMLVVGYGLGFVVGGIVDRKVVEAPTSNMAGMMMDMNSGLVGLRGAEFDRKFLTEMILHHQGAVDMANLVLKNDSRPELKDFANKIINAQTTEIEQMQAWLKSW